MNTTNRNALEQLGEKGVIFKFPPAFASTHTALVLKEPKTKTSVRKVLLKLNKCHFFCYNKKQSIMAIMSTTKR